MEPVRTDSGESNQFRPRGETHWVSMGEFIVELAYVRNESTHQDVDPAPERDRRRPQLRAVPDLAPASRPALPRRRPSRRAVVRAQVWGVPLLGAGDDERPSEWAPVDERIAEAVRLLGGL
jgi:hypothetical protein